MGNKSVILSSHRTGMLLVWFRNPFFPASKKRRRTQMPALEKVSYPEFNGPSNATNLVGFETKVNAEPVDGILNHRVLRIW
jgi:hypothetical protein